jgi:uncharacterized repeat protein (TIGR01451 family)
MRWKPLLALLVFAAAASPAAAQFLLKTAVAGFTDINGNGVLDCGEPVKIYVALSSPNAIVTGAQAYSGTLTFPTQGGTGLVFVPGSVQPEPQFTAGCAVTGIPAGNGPDDLSASVTFECLPSGPNVIPIVTVSFEAGYFNSVSPSYSATAHAHVVPATGPAVDLDSQPMVEDPPPAGICTGQPNQVLVTKTESGTAAPGSTIVYALTARDTSGLGDGGIQLTDVVPDNTQFAPAASDPGWVCPSSAAGSLCRLPVGNLTPSGTVTRYFAVTVDTPLPAGVSSLANTACARGGPVTVLGCGSTTTPTAGMAMLKMAKSLKSGTGAPGSTLSYQLTVTNSGNQGASASTAAETVPANTTFDQAASDPGWTCTGSAAGSTCSLPLPPIAAGGSAGAVFAVDVAAQLPAGTAAIANTACVNSGSALDCSSVMTPTTGMAVLSVHKTVAGTAAPGATLTYSIAVQNTGSEGAAGVSVTETVPDLTSFSAAGSSPGWSCQPSGGSGSLCSQTIASLPAGATVTLAFAVVVAAPLPVGATAIANSACAALPVTEAHTSAAMGSSCDSVSTPTAGAPRLTLVKTYGGGPVVPGGVLAFGLAVANAGNQDAGPVAVSETVPAQTAFDAAASSPGWTCTPGTAAGSACTLTLPGLAAGAAQSLVFAVQAGASLPPGATVANAACASSTAAGQTLSACSSATTPPALSTATTLAVALAIDADHSGDASPGDTLRYTLVIPNATGATLTGLLSKLDLDPNETLVAGSVTTDHGTVTTGNAAGDRTVVVAVGDLPAGASATVVFETKVNLGLPAGTTEVTAQAETSGTNIPTDASSDPATPQIPHDPTSIAVHVRAPQAAAVPTLGAVGLAALAGCLLLAALRVLRRARGTAWPGA